MNTSEAIVAHAAEALQEVASSHKRAADYHRRQAWAVKEKLSRLIRAAQEMGIKIITP